jgi:hypothetical protein
MSHRPTRHPPGHQRPQRAAVPGGSDHRAPFYPQYGRAQQYPAPPMYYYPQAPPYVQGKVMHPQEPTAPTRSQEPTWSQTRPPPPPDASYDRLKPAPPQATPAPLPPPKAQEKKPMFARPPPPNAPISSIADDFVLPATPTFVPDHTKAPGCFDILGRGSLPPIRFTAEVTV